MAHVDGMTRIGGAMEVMRTTVEGDIVEVVTVKEAITEVGIIEAVITVADTANARPTEVLRRAPCATKWTRTSRRHASLVAA